MKALERILKAKELPFGEEYYRSHMYSRKERLIKKHIFDVIQWGAEVSSSDLLNGKGKTALDVGCAYGYGVEVLKSLGYDAYGIDISKYSIRKAKDFYSADFLICDVQKGLPFKDDFFDLLICIGVIEHLAHPLQALRGIFASCRGTMIFTTPNRLVERPIKKIMGDYDETHINVKSWGEWKDYFEALGSAFFKAEPFLDLSLTVKGKLLFFKSFKIPHLGLDLRILVKK